MLCAPAFGQTTAEDWVEKGVDLSLQGNFDEAIKAYDKAIEIDPQFAGAWNAEGIALQALGRNAEADKAFAKARELGYTD